MQAVRRTHRSRLDSESWKKKRKTPEYDKTRCIQVYLQSAAVYENIHHLGHTESVAEVVKWVVSVILLNPQQEPLEGRGVDV